MDLTIIPQALSSLKIASDIGKGILASKIDIEIQANVIEMQSAIIDAQHKCIDANRELSDAQKKISDLHNEISRLKDFSDKIKLLKRKRNMFADPDNQDEYYCSRCAESDNKLIHVSKTVKIEMGKRIYTCPQCKNDYS